MPEDHFAPGGDEPTGYDYSDLDAALVPPNPADDLIAQRNALALTGIGDQPLTSKQADALQRQERLATRKAQGTRLAELSTVFARLSAGAQKNPPKSPREAGQLARALCDLNSEITGLENALCEARSQEIGTLFREEDPETKRQREELAALLNGPGFR